MDDEIRQSDTGGFLRAAKNEGVLRFRASTDAIDRHQSIVIQKGIDFRNFSGAFLWGHDSFKGMFGGGPEIKNNLGKVIGKSMTKFMRGNKPAMATDIDVRFSEVNPFAVMAEGMVREGILGNTSIAFIPDPTKMRKEEIKGKEIRIFDRVELLEISLVPVPSNPEAVALVRSMNLSLGEELVEVPHGSVQHRSDENGDWFFVKDQWQFRVPGKLKTVSELMNIGEPVRGIVPANVSISKAPVDQGWTGLTIQKAWEEMTSRERQRIMGHFAWSPSSKTEEFGFNEMKLSHHDPRNGSVVLKRVKAAMDELLGARGGVKIPTEDRRKVYNHLAAHMRSFDCVPPDFRSADVPPPKGADSGTVGQVISKTVKTFVEKLRS